MAHATGSGNFLLVNLAAFLALMGLASTAEAQKNSAGQFRFAKSSFNVAENVGVAVIEVRRHQGSAGAASVEFRTADGSALDGDDYTGVSGKLSWADGESASKTFDVPILDDDDREKLETIGLTLLNPEGADLHRNSSRAEIKILPSDQATNDDDDDDQTSPAGGWLAFDQRTYQSSENARVAVVTVTRRGSESGAVSVDYETMDGSAEAPVDYSETNGTLSWDDGDSGVLSFTVEIVDDEEREKTEKFGLKLTNAQGGAEVHPGRDHAAVLIHDNDQLNDDSARSGVFRFVRGEFQTIEDRDFAEIRVERLYGKQQPVSVDYETTDGTAEAGLDYEAVSGTLVWARGDARVKSFLIPLLRDDLDEGNETVLLSLANPGGGAIIAPDGGEATLNILDEDSGSSVCAADETTACLQGGRFEVTVTWRTPEGSGAGQVIPLSRSSTLFWFFEEENVEMLVKILDGCAIFDAYWVFYAATTDVDFTMKVTDTVSGLSKEYSNMLGEAADAVTDTLTFATCTN